MAQGHAGRDEDEERNFEAEFETFLLEHDTEISVEEVYHLNPQVEETEDIRQHNHAVLRSKRSKRVFTLCMTSWNWDQYPVLPPHVLLSLAMEALRYAEAEGEFMPWAMGQGFDLDSRAAERKFRQTGEMVSAVRSILGERAYGELIELAAAASAAFSAGEGEGEEE